jgi:TRAP-type C4-dicarboxylate transport system permease small subunit
MIWALFLGGAYAYLDGEHVGITYFSDKFSKKVSILNNILVNGAIIIFLIALMYGGWQETNMLKTFNTGALGISRAIPYAAIPVSAALYIIFSIIIISNSIRMRLK